MALLFSSGADDPARWRAELNARLPDLDFRVWPDAVGDPLDIEYALAWRPKPGALRAFPNLKAIFSLGAGVDHLFRDPDLPAGVPVVRLVDKALTRNMTQYVLHWVLHHHRAFQQYAELQHRGEWRTLPVPDPPERRRVGVMGLGVLGKAVARALLGLGFTVAGWSRTPKHVAGVESFAGDAGLAPFLGRLDVLVCLLPLTPETGGIIDKRTLSALPAGAYLINVARGGHLVDEDLVEALDSGHVAGATLDVFREEPLPEAHPFWAHPRVAVTPHIASQTDPRSAADEVAANIRRIRAGERPINIADPTRGY
jgi:glyoxylate/hydroxypyruvate reductase A